MGERENCRDKRKEAAASNRSDELIITRLHLEKKEPEARLLSGKHPAVKLENI